MRISATPTVQVSPTPAQAAPAQPAPATPADTVEVSKGGTDKFKMLKRAVFWSTAGAIPGVGAVTNFMAGATGVGNVLRQSKDAEANSSRNTALSIGAAVLGAAPNVIGALTHQTGWYLGSMVIGGVLGAATAYQAKQ